MEETGVVFHASFLEEGDPQEDYAYAFLRLEHECLTATGYWKRATGCDPDPFLLALKIFFDRSWSLMETLGGNKLDKKCRRRLLCARLHAAKILSLLNEIQQPVVHIDDAEYLMGQMFLNLTRMKKKIQPMLPSESPFRGHEDLTALIRQQRGLA